jgi:hypothetical protein
LRQGRGLRSGRTPSGSLDLLLFGRPFAGITLRPPRKDSLRAPSSQGAIGSDSTVQIFAGVTPLTASRSRSPCSSRGDRSPLNPGASRRDSREGFGRELSRTGGAKRRGVFALGFATTSNCTLPFTLRPKRRPAALTARHRPAGPPFAAPPASGLPPSRHLRRSQPTKPQSCYVRDTISAFDFQFCCSIKAKDLSRTRQNFGFFNDAGARVGAGWGGVRGGPSHAASG